MQLDGELAVVQARAAGLGLRVVANDGWLVSGLLADATLNPRRYLALAEQEQALRRALLALTERLLNDAAVRTVA